MTLSRRNVLAGALAAPAILRYAPAQAATTLKISHQFPGGTIDKAAARRRRSRMGRSYNSSSDCAHSSMRRPTCTAGTKR